MRLTVNPDLCTLCGACLLTCPADMIREKEGRIKIGRVMCIECGHCVSLCPEGAITVEEGGEFSAAEGPPVTPDALRALILSRRSIRRYQPRMVPRELLEQMLDAARWTPTAANCQCQAFTVITDPARRNALAARVADFYRAYAEALADREHTPERLAALGVLLPLSRQGEGAGGEVHPHMQAAVPAFVKNVDAGRDRLFFGAPVVIIVHADGSEVLPETACAFATMILALMAESLGLGTCITGYASEALGALPELRADLGLPESHQVHYVLTVGYPAGEYRLLPPRKPAQVRWL
jgi:nitroreductase/NAD-dependent dihydropyrimidine dehydrogenase PreA subunit